MIEMINEYASEHLIIACESYREIAQEIVNAGSIFLGNYTPESAGDYASGTNHTLPTNGWARAYSGLNMDAFFKKITLQEISESGLLNISNAIINMANAEELQAHSNAVSIRLPKED
jgi:histidinol dehydrogenase